MRELIETEVEFEIECLPEDLPVRGNAIASDDPEFDKKVEDEILDKLERGFEWAWCCVRVIARWEGFEGDAYLGGVSCDNEEAFTTGDSDYYEALKQEALDLLNLRLAETAQKLEVLRVTDEGDK